MKLKDLYEVKTDKLRQKARIRWQLKGDRNSRFFHNIANFRWRKNHILGINWNTIWCSSPHATREAFLDYFQNFFKSKFSKPVFKLVTLPIPKLSKEASCSLSLAVTMSELEHAIRLSPSNKAPGPDGISMDMIKGLWNTIKKDMPSFVHKFQTEGFLPQGSNSSFIVLVPKSRDLRPISLINASMKLISKILALRLKTKLPNLISNTQSGFMQGR